MPWLFVVVTAASVVEELHRILDSWDSNPSPEVAAVESGSFDSLGGDQLEEEALLDKAVAHTESVPAVVDVAGAAS